MATPRLARWGRWARFVLRHPWPVALSGLAVVGVLVFYGLQLNPNEAQLKNFPGTGTAIAGRQMLADANISPGAMKPFIVLVEHGGNANAIAAKIRPVPGIVGAAAPASWRSGGDSLVEAIPAVDGAAPGIQTIINNTNAALAGTDGTLGGVPAVDRDFVHAIYGNFPYLLAFVLILTLILLTRAFRSIVLALKAVILNLLSLAAAFGLIVIIFQNGHGSSLWNITATHAITAWIPLMIFAFLYGLSMDYEVFMLTRMREAYDETGSTDQAIELGLSRTGKLVTSAALILMFAFLVLSSSPGYEIKVFAIGLAAGIIFDATVIRILLVPSLMKLLGDWNWYLPTSVARVLRVRRDRSRRPRPSPHSADILERPGCRTSSSPGGDRAALAVQERLRDRVSGSRSPRSCRSPSHDAALAALRETYPRVERSRPASSRSPGESGSRQLVRGGIALVVSAALAGG